MVLVFTEEQKKAALEQVKAHRAKLAAMSPEEREAYLKESNRLPTPEELERMETFEAQGLI